MKTPQKEQGEITDGQNPAAEQNVSDSAAVWRDTVVKQIKLIRDTGLTNMFGSKSVFTLAVKNDFYELADFITESKESYSKFILTGDFELIVRAA